MQEDVLLANLTYLGVAHCDPARAHELPLDEEGLDERRASAEDGLEGLAPGLANVLQQERAITAPHARERKFAGNRTGKYREEENVAATRERGGGETKWERYGQKGRGRERRDTRSVTRLTI